MGDARRVDLRKPRRLCGYEDGDHRQVAKTERADPLRGPSPHLSSVRSASDDLSGPHLVLRRKASYTLSTRRMAASTRFNWPGSDNSTS